MNASHALPPAQSGAIPPKHNQLKHCTQNGPSPAAANPCLGRIIEAVALQPSYLQPSPTSHVFYSDIGTAIQLFFHGFELLCFILIDDRHSVRIFVLTASSIDPSTPYHTAGI